MRVPGLCHEGGAGLSPLMSVSWTEAGGCTVTLALPALSWGTPQSISCPGRWTQSLPQ